MIDTHCHIDCIDNIEDIINNFDGIIITSGYDDKSNLKVIELADRYDKVYGTLGIHPEEASNEYNMDIIINNLDNPKIIGIGEIGLDYHYTKDNIDEQIDLFKKQLDIAQKYNLPVVVHSRDAIEDTYNILNGYNLKGSIHCFSSSLEMARKFINIGYKIGVGGVITFKNGKKLRDVVSGINIKDILTETDSPYLSPEPNRGKVNNPSNVYYVIKEISNIKGISIDEVKTITMKNAEDVFNKMKGMN